MKLKNLTTNETLILPDGLYWVDEFDDNDLEQRVERSIEGFLLIFEQEKIGGQPLTLSSNNSENWVDRATLTKLKEWGRMSSLLMELSLELPLDIRVFIVSFRLDGKENKAEKKALRAKEKLEQSGYAPIDTSKINTTQTASTADKKEAAKKAKQLKAEAEQKAKEEAEEANPLV